MASRCLVANRSRRRFPRGTEDTSHWRGLPTNEAQWDPALVNSSPVTGLFTVFARAVQSILKPDEASVVAQIEHGPANHKPLHFPGRGLAPFTSAIRCGHEIIGKCVSREKVPSGEPQLASIWEPTVVPGRFEGTLVEGIVPD